MIEIKSINVDFFQGIQVISYKLCRIDSMTDKKTFIKHS